MISELPVERLRRRGSNLSSFFKVMEEDQLTDRIVGYMVILEESMREDDAEAITNALAQIKGVAKVEPVINNPSLEAIIESRTRSNLWTAMHDAMGDIFFPERKKEE